MTAERTSFLDMMPKRTSHWQREKDETIVLLIPRIKSRFMRRIFGKRMKNPHYILHLDRIGSYVWERCDGTTTIGHIADELRETMGPEVEPVYDRVALFMQQLESNGFISLSSKDTAP